MSHPVGRLANIQEYNGTVFFILESVIDYFNYYMNLFYCPNFMPETEDTIIETLTVFS